MDVRILSAKLGLIDGRQAIPDYDQRMTLRRAQELQPKVIAELVSVLDTQTYTAFFIGLGRDYLPALAGYAEMIPPTAAVKTTAGALGKQLVDLRCWLYEETDLCSVVAAPADLPQRACLRGVEIAQTADEVMEIARQALKQGVGNPATYQAWHVLVDGIPVAPKWVVSLLTGLPASAFHSEEARRVLRRLGIPVHVG